MTIRTRAKVAASALALATTATLFTAAPAAADPIYAWGTSVPGAKSKCMDATNKKIKQIRNDGGVLVRNSICKFSLSKNHATGKLVIYHSTNISWRIKY